MTPAVVIAVVILLSVLWLKFRDLWSLKLKRDIEKKKEEIDTLHNTVIMKKEGVKRDENTYEDALKEYEDKYGTVPLPDDPDKSGKS